MTTANRPKFAAALPWSRWPWDRCKAVATGLGWSARCDLHRAHNTGFHLAERGMENVVWDERFILDDAGLLRGRR